MNASATRRFPGRREHSPQRTLSSAHRGLDDTLPQIRFTGYDDLTHRHLAGLSSSPPATDTDEPGRWAGMPAAPGVCSASLPALRATHKPSGPWKAQDVFDERGRAPRCRGGGRSAERGLSARDGAGRLSGPDRCRVRGPARPIPLQHGEVLEVLRRGAGRALALSGLECPPTDAGAGPGRPCRRPTIPARTWRSRSTRKTGTAGPTVTGRSPRSTDVWCRGGAWSGPHPACLSLTPPRARSACARRSDDTHGTSLGASHF